VCKLFTILLFNLKIWLSSSLLISSQSKASTISSVLSILLLVDCFAYLNSCLIDISTASKNLDRNSNRSSRAREGEGEAVKVQH